MNKPNFTSPKKIIHKHNHNQALQIIIFKKIMKTPKNFETLTFRAL